MISEKKRIAVTKNGFQKGNVSHNTYPIGAIITRKDTYDTPRLWIKIAQPSVWIKDAVFVWEQQNGPVLKGYVIHHIDVNSMNDEITNLACLTKSEHTILHAKIRALSGKKRIFKLKEITCTKCGETFLGSEKRKDSTCEKCLKESKRLYSIEYYKNNKNYKVYKNQHIYDVKELTCSRCGHTFFEYKKPPSGHCPECRKEVIKINRKKRHDAQQKRKLDRIMEWE